MEFHRLPKVDQQKSATRRCKKSLFYGHIFNFEYGRSMVSSQRIAGRTVNPDAIHRSSIETSAMHEPEKPASYRNRTGFDILNEQYAALLSK
jgi:hypothetical protein